MNHGLFEIGTGSVLRMESYTHSFKLTERSGCLISIHEKSKK